jgi:transcriptional regulator with XRE-family HTH domain
VKRPLHKARRQPKKLARKLLAIREAFGMSQPEFIKVLDDAVKQQSLSNWETGRREPDLLVLLRYSEVANVCLDVLIDDEFELPATIPAKGKRHNPKNP